MDTHEQYVAVVDKLSEYLGLLKEDGVQAFEVDRVTLASLGQAVVTPAASAAPGTSKARKPAASKPTAPRELPDANLHYALAERMAACGDATPPELHRLVILSDTGSFAGKPGELLANILKAGGYELVSEPTACTETGVLYTQAARALVLMGEPALQALRPRAKIMIAAGKFKNINGLDTLCTFDTTYIETHSATKKAMWQSLKDLLKRLELSVPDWVGKAEVIHRFFGLFRCNW